MITKEDILKHVTQEEIYSYYLGEDVTRLGVFHSPLREDNIPSFAIYFHKSEQNVLMFKDYATGDCGDFVVLVMKLFNIRYREALRKITYDLGLTQQSVDADRQQITYTKIVQKQKVNLGVKTRKWNKGDKEFWSSFGITKKTLEKYNVHPVEYVFYNDNPVSVHALAYVYVEFKDDEVTYKIYQPLESKEKKWINNANSTVHQGYSQLPETDEILIITKSLKDVMAIHDVIGIPAIGLQSESIGIKESVMEEYRSRFTNVVCLFDNDPAGIKLTESFSEKYDLPYFYMPQLIGVTDFSDLVQSIGILEARRTFNNLLSPLLI